MTKEMTQQELEQQVAYDQRVLRATDMWESVLRTKRSLITKRRALGLSQQDVADLLGLSLKKVKRFEHYDNDPKMSIIFLYALLIGDNDGSTVQLKVVENPIT